MTYYIWRDGYVDNGSDKRVRSRECAFEEIYADERLKADIRKEAMAKKSGEAISPLRAGRGPATLVLTVFSFEGTTKQRGADIYTDLNVDGPFDASHVYLGWKTLEVLRNSLRGISRKIWLRFRCGSMGVLLKLLPFTISQWFSLGQAPDL